MWAVINLGYLNTSNVQMTDTGFNKIKGPK